MQLIPFTFTYTMLHEKKLYGKLRTTKNFQNSMPMLRTSSGRPKAIDDASLQTLLDEDDMQAQDQLVEVLNMTYQGIFKCLHVIGKIQKNGKWVSHKLTETDGKQRVTFQILLLRHERKCFLY